MKLTTLCFLVRDSEILLAMKKRGFGTGKFNGVGGKVSSGESVLSATIRETEEEIGVRIAPEDLQYRATLTFHFDGKPEWDQVTHVFLASRWTGEPAESEEMAPQWFSNTTLPFEKMWVDDPHWLPKVISGASLAATFVFDAEGKIIKSKMIEEVKDLVLTD